jgi:HK97 family phage major capsid protein
MRKPSEIRAELSEASNDLVALSEMESVTLEQIQAAKDKCDALEAEFNQAEEFETIRASVVARNQELNAASVQPPSEPIETPMEVKNVIPSKISNMRVKNFASAEDAYVAGQYLAHLGGDQRAGEILAAQSVGTDDKGGFTVPDPLSNALINLLEDYGVARQYCRRVVMSALTWSVPKVAAHAAVSYPDEAAAIGETDVTFSQVLLTAKKIAALVKMSTEVTEDSIVSIMDTVVQSLAYSIAIAEDQNLFNGVNLGINQVGIKGDASVADTNVASVSALALDDLTACSVSIGNPIVGARNAWYINPTLYHGPVRDLLNAAGGNTIVDLEGGQRPSLLGYPVVFTNALPGASASTSGDLLAVFGDLSLGCYFGDRRSVTFKMLNELYAENDQVGVQVTERIALEVVNPEVLGKITLT